MVQIPVLPLEVAFKEWTHWVYADEFAETHTKNIFVRQSINAHIPSAGVGTGFSRQALAALGIENGKGGDCHAGVFPTGLFKFGAAKITLDYWHHFSRMGSCAVA